MPLGIFPFLQNSFSDQGINFLIHDGLQIRREFGHAQLQLRRGTLNRDKNNFDVADKRFFSTDRARNLPANARGAEVQPIGQHQFIDKVQGSSAGELFFFFFHLPFYRTEKVP